VSGPTKPDIIGSVEPSKSRMMRVPEVTSSAVQRLQSTPCPSERSPPRVRPSSRTNAPPIAQGRRSRRRRDDVLLQRTQPANSSYSSSRVPFLPEGMRSRSRSSGLVRRPGPPYRSHFRGMTEPCTGPPRFGLAAKHRPRPLLRRTLDSGSPSTGQPDGPGRRVGPPAGTADLSWLSTLGGCR
jgi:hypothetical protein